MNDIPILSATCLIPFKAKAWLDLKERKAKGEAVDSKNIKKHKNDVFRLAQLLTTNSRQQLGNEILNDMQRFLAEMENEPLDLKSLGVRGLSKEEILNVLYQCYEIQK